MTTTNPTPYTPNDEDVRDAWYEPPSIAAALSFAHYDARSAEWDRWLAARGARGRAEAVAPVLALHIPAGSPPVCVHCQGSQGGQIRFPCPTVRAVSIEQEPRTCDECPETTDVHQYGTVRLCRSCHHDAVRSDWTPEEAT